MINTTNPSKHIPGGWIHNHKTSMQKHFIVFDRNRWTNNGNPISEDEVISKGKPGQIDILFIGPLGVDTDGSEPTFNRPPRGYHLEIENTYYEPEAMDRGMPHPSIICEVTLLNKNM
jgi:hypothetical protein